MNEASWLHRGSIIVAVTCAAVLGTAARAPAQVSTKVGGMNFSIGSFVQADWAFSTADKANPYNSHDLSTEHNTWNQMAQRGEALVSLELTSNQASKIGLDSLRMFVHPRFYSDTAPEVDSNLPEVNLFGGRDGGRYRGNGWLASTTGTHEYVLDAQEAYIDLRSGPVRMRLGKQQIAWGTALFLRSLDAVDSLDLRRHGIFDPIGNEYADTRIAEWTALGTYEFPDFGGGVSSTSLSGFVSPDFQPFILPAAGSAYNVLPSQTLLKDGEDIAQARHKIVWGGVAKTTALGIDWTLNFVSTPQTLGVFSFKPGDSAALAPGIPFHPDSRNGFNSLGDFVSAVNVARLSVPAIGQTLTTAPFTVPGALLQPVALDNFLRSTPLDGILTRKFPRENIYGGSASYYMQPIYDFPGASMINGNLFKFEGTYTPNKPFTTSGLSPTPKRVGELNVALEMEKQVRWNEKLPSAFCVVEYWFKSRGDFFNRYVAYEGENKFQVVGVAIQQGLLGNRVRVDNSIVIDVAGPGLWYQPGISYKPRDYLQYDLYYNYYQGTNRDTFGALGSFDEFFMKATYKF